MNSRSCLTLILACVIYRYAKEISWVVRWCRPEDDKIDEALPVSWFTVKWNFVRLA
jgi:hypothetical protein